MRNLRNLKEKSNPTEKNEKKNKKRLTIASINQSPTSKPSTKISTNYNNKATRKRNYTNGETI